MCGILGCLGAPVSDEQAGRMLAVLKHRGPDDHGEWRDESESVWLGHRRLSVVDLSSAGRQPMASASGRYVIAYNGEVYNHGAMRAELERAGETFRGHSDTEVMLAAVERWGLQDAIGRFVGMFAFALYDRQERCVWLARDRIGIKPLYYAPGPQRLAFASELSALTVLPWVDREIDPDALAAYFRYLAVPAPASILKGVRKLLPGTLLRWDRQGMRTISFWRLADIARRAAEQRRPRPMDELVGDFEQRLREAVGARMLADVPLGAFLSGGIDSSLVVAMMQSLSNRPVKTYSIGFAEESHDESRYARAVAKHLQTDHHELILSPAEALQTIPEIAANQDEPFADGSIVPTFLLCRFAREDVTVALSGDGGDELFGGYPRYFWASRIEAVKRRLSPAGARCLGRALRSSPSWLWDGILNRLTAGRLGGAEGLSARVRRLAGYLETPPDRVYEDMISAWPDPSRLLRGRHKGHASPPCGELGRLSWAERMMASDQTGFLPDDILTKLDRASMWVSLEARVPLLDHRLVEWSWTLGSEAKFGGHLDRGKLIMRELLYRHVPRELIERPKMGFGMPMAAWLRRELREWAEDLLHPAALEDSGLLDPSVVVGVWREHLDGENRLPQLWTVLMFRSWQEHWRAQVRDV